jgi:dihydroneopterin aldolase
LNSPCILSINDLRIWLHLGCSDAEKQNPQLVSFNIKISFKTPPNGITTDQLDDTVCYLEITKKIQSLCQGRRFNLIEHLAYEAKNTITKHLENNHNINELQIAVHKIAPPVPGVHGGVTFTYTENVT